MGRTKSHDHNFELNKRVNRIIIFKCRCGQTMTKLIAHFTKERAAEFDRRIEDSDSGGDAK